MASIFDYFNHIVTLKEEDKGLLQQVLKPLELKKGEHFIDYGQRASKLAFVNTGLLEMSVFEESDEKMLDFIFPNSFATDYLCFLQDKPAETRITAIKASSLWLIEKADLENLYTKNERFQKLGRLIAEAYYIEFVQRLRMIHINPKERYEKLRAQNPEMIQKIPQYKIASYLNVSAEWLSKLKAI